MKSFSCIVLLFHLCNSTSVVFCHAPISYCLHNNSSAYFLWVSERRSLPACRARRVLEQCQC